MGCGESKHDVVATGNIISKIKKPSFRSVSSSSKTTNKSATKQGDSLLEKKSDVIGKEETAEEKAVSALEEAQQISPSAKETEQKVDYNAKPVVVLVEETPQAVKEDAALVIAEEKTSQQDLKENPAAVTAEEKKPAVEEKPLLQETKVEKEKEEPIVLQEEKLVVIKEKGVTTKVEEEKATKEGNLAVKAAQLVEEKGSKEDNLAIKKLEAAKSVDEAETGKKEEKPTIHKETKADSAAANGLKNSSEMK